MFHIAKHALKYVAFTHDYEISSLPIDQKGIINDLLIKVTGIELKKE